MLNNNVLTHAPWTLLFDKYGNQLSLKEGSHPSLGFKISQKLTAVYSKGAHVPSEVKSVQWKN